MNIKKMWKISTLEMEGQIKHSAFWDTAHTVLWSTVLFTNVYNLLL